MARALLVVVLRDHSASGERRRLGVDAPKTGIVAESRP
jgi:hypothetical protein